MFKEEGYDAFLAERIKAGQEALARGEIVSREQALIEIRQAILEAEKELDAQELSQMNGIVYG